MRLFLNQNSNCSFSVLTGSGFGLGLGFGLGRGSGWAVPGRTVLCAAEGEREVASLSARVNREE